MVVSVKLFSLSNETYVYETVCEQKDKTKDSHKVPRVREFRAQIISQQTSTAAYVSCPVQ